MSKLVVHTAADGTTTVRRNPPKRTRISLPWLRRAIANGLGGVAFLIRIGDPLGAALYRVTGWDDTTGHLDCELEEAPE